MATNFRLELIELSVREVFMYFFNSGPERRAGASEEKRKEHGSNLARPETASELKITVDPQPL